MFLLACTCSNETRFVWNLVARSSYELNVWDLNALLYKWIYKVSLQSRSNSDASNHDFWNDMVVFLYMILTHLGAFWVPLGIILAVVEAIRALNGSIGRRAFFHRAFCTHVFIRDHLVGAPWWAWFCSQVEKTVLASIVGKEIQLHPKYTVRHIFWQHLNDFEACFHSKT